MIKEGTNKTSCYGSMYWGGDDSQANTWVLFSQRRIKVKTVWVATIKAIRYLKRIIVQA